MPLFSSVLFIRFCPGETGLCDKLVSGTPRCGRGTAPLLVHLCLPVLLLCASFVMCLHAVFACQPGEDKILHL